MDKELERLSFEYVERGDFTPIVPHICSSYTTLSPSMAVGQSRETLSAEETTNSTSFVDIRPFMATFPTGVSVITAMDNDGHPWGMTCTSICSVTLEPPTLLVCLRWGSPTLGAVLASSGFALNLLHDSARPTAELFASGEPDRFARLAWHRPFACKGPHFIEAAHSIADCRVVHAEIFGNHMVVFGEVLQVTQQSEEFPLLYGLRGYIRWPGNAEGESNVSGKK